MEAKNDPTGRASKDTHPLEEAGFHIKEEGKGETQRGPRFPEAVIKGYGRQAAHLYCGA